MILALYGIAGIIILVVVLIFLAPKTYQVSRSIEIFASKNSVFDYVRYLKRQNEWSPWFKKDAHMNIRITGIDGQVGAINYWSGNKEVGEGEQEIMSIIDGEKVEMELRFYRPLKSISYCCLSLETITETKTKVIWSFKGETNFPMNIFTLFVNMDKMVGTDFEEGLGTLKLIVERTCDA